MVFCLFILPLLIVSVRSFSLSIPSNVTVLEEFAIDWTSDTSDPQNIAVLVLDLTRTPQCLASNVPFRERIVTVQGVSNGQGRLDSIQVPHSGSYLMCAFSYESEPPERSLRSSLFNSTVISAFIRPQTTTITSGSSPTGESSARSSSNRDGPIIGGVLGGFFALLIALVLLPFWFCRYRIVCKTTNSGSNEALMSASHLEGSHMPYEPQTGGYFTYYTAAGHATSDAASSSYPPMSPPAGPSRAASEGGWGSQSGPSETAETEIPPAYAIVSANRRVKN